MLCVRPWCRVLVGVSAVALALAMPLSVFAEEADSAAMGGVLVDEATADLPAFSNIDLSDEDPLPRARKKVPVENPYDAVGLRVGRIIVFPTLELGATASSNPARVATGAEADVGLRLKPGLRLQSDWSRHQWTASASSELLRYMEQDDLSATRAEMASSLRLDARHSTRVTLETGYTLSSTGPSDRDVPNTAIENLVSHTLQASAAVEHDVGAGSFALRGGLLRGVYEDVRLSGGLSEDNGDRNYMEAALSLRGTFNRHAVLRPFGEVSYTPRVHDRRIDRNGLRRDSHGFGTTVGLQFAGDPLWSGEIAATLEVRDFEDGALKTEVAPGLLANLQWRPTELTRVDFTADVSLSETTAATDGATTTWNAGTTVTHALRDNLDLTAGMTGEISALSAALEFTFATRAGLEWKMNPNFSWSAAYEGTYVFSEGDDYHEQQVIAGIILKR
jgi:hypothetical protein